MRKNPAFNLVVTNIPGPQLALYFDGAKLHSQYGMAPITDGMGLILVVMSYNGSVGIGVTVCRELMPDPGVFAKYLNEACEELRKTTKKVKKKTAKAVSKKTPVAKTRKKSQKVDVTKKGAESHC
jgi:hypothetical protein